jgi:hypothetical protein
MAFVCLIPVRIRLLGNIPLSGEKIHLLWSTHVNPRKKFIQNTQQLLRSDCFAEPLVFSAHQNQQPALH